MECEGVIRGTDSGDGFVGRIPAAHGCLSGAVDKDLGEIGEQRVGMRRNPAGGLLPGRFPCFRNGIRRCPPYVPAIRDGNLWMAFRRGMLWVMYDTLPGLSSIERRGKRGNGTGVPAMYTGHLDKESVQCMDAGYRVVHLRPG